MTVSVFVATLTCWVVIGYVITFDGLSCGLTPTIWGLTMVTLRELWSRTVTITCGDVSFCHHHWCVELWNVLAATTRLTMMTLRELWSRTVTITCGDISFCHHYWCVELWNVLAATTRYTMMTLRELWSRTVTITGNRKKNVIFSNIIDR